MNGRDITLLFAYWAASAGLGFALTSAWLHWNWPLLFFLGTFVLSLGILSLVYLRASR